MKPKSWSFYALVMSALFLLLAVLVKTGRLVQLDFTLEQIILNTRNPAATAICKALSLMGKWYTYAGLSCLLFLFPKTRFRLGLPVGFTLGAAMVMNKILKTLLAIERPSYSRLSDAHGYSFPSGHAMYGAAFLGILVYLLLPKIKTSVKRVMAIDAAAVFLLAVGFSRVYLGVHHPSDIIGGYLAGLAVFFIAVLLNQQFRHYKLLSFNKKPPY